MLTAHKEWLTAAGRRSSAGRVIAIISTSSQDLAAATAPFDFSWATSTPVHYDALIDEIAPISRSVDFLSMKVEYANCQMILTGLPIARDESDSRWRRITDMAGQLIGANVQLMLYPGGAITAYTSRALTIGYFRVINFSLSGIRLTLSLEESRAAGVTGDLSALETVLPQHPATQTIFPGLPLNRVGLSMPLLYGNVLTMPQIIDLGWHPIERVADDYFLVADHALASGTKRFVVALPEVDGYAIVVYDSTNIEYVSSGGRTLAHIKDRYALTFLAVVPPTGAYHDGGVADPGLAAAFDEHTYTYGNILATSTTAAIAYFEFAHSGAPEDSRTANSIAEIVEDTAAIFIIVESVASIAHSYLEVYDGTSWVTIATDIHTGEGGTYAMNPAYDWTGSKGVFWHFSAGPKGGGGSYPFICRLRCTGSGWTAGSTVVIRVYELKFTCNICGVFARAGRSRHAKAIREDIIIDPRLDTWAWRGNALQPQKRDISQYKYYYSGYGRAYGSWIDEEGRSNSYNAGDVITEPHYIIESILRDELGFDASQIDVAAFDACAHGSHRLSLEMGSKVSARDIIESICYESGLVCFRGANGVWTIKSYAAPTSADATILPDELSDMTVELGCTPLSSIVNRMLCTTMPVNNSTDIYSRETVNDTASQALHGIRDGEAEFHGGGDKSALAERAAKTHRTVKARTLGWRLATVELMDAISFDDSLDAHILYFGESWSGKMFLVYGVSVGLDGVTLDLWDTTGVT